MLREDTARQRAFVKSRADAQLELEKRCPSQEEAQVAGPVIWRVGTKHIARALRPWTLKCASSSDHGGLPGRSTSDVLFQLQAAIKRGVNTAALMDVAGYFDSLNVPAMRQVFVRLGAPPQLLPLLESFYSDARRYFNFEGSYDPGVHVVRSGFGQGCPLSPLAAAALSHWWSEYVKASSANIGAQIFMDDRTLWVEPQGSLQDLDAALHASADFDQAFSLQLAEDKCFVAAKHHTEATRLLAAKWNFLTCGSLELLGVSFNFEGAGAIPKFSLRKAVLRLRLLRWTQAATTSRIMLVRSLVMPCLAWAAGFARPSENDVKAVQHEVRFLFNSGYGGDVATVAFYELLGWGLEPSFALDMGLCRLFWRWVSKPPVWQEEVPIGHCPGSGLEAPKHRGEERLLAKHLAEPPLPPPAVDADGLVDETADAILAEMLGATSIAIATDGSSKDGVAAHAVVVNTAKAAEQLHNHLECLPRVCAATASDASPPPGTGV
ncbi:unnamed protein product [Symbiodinium sp. CCMP2592]|nr:unnamed protein product [Symbiodinium sp. CCMP2592]